MKKLRRTFKNAISEEKGVSSIELIIILAVLVTLAFVFKDFILSLAKNIFDKITEKTNKNIDDLARTVNLILNRRNM